MATETIDIVVKERGSRTVRRNIEDIGKGARTAQGAVSLLNRVLGTIGVGVGLGSLIRLGDTAVSVRNRLQVLETGALGVQGTLDRLFQSANRGRQSMESLIGIYQRGTIASKELGASQEDLFQFTDTVSNALRIEGRSADELRGTLLQLSQTLGSGIVRGEEFNSILENGFILAQAAARGLDRAGGSVARLRTMIIKGEVTSSEFFRSILSQSDRIAQMSSRVTDTVGQSMTLLRNNLIKMIGDVNQATGVMTKFAQAVGYAANNVEVFAKILGGILGIAAFNLLTSSLLNFGRAGAGVLTFMTAGFVNLGQIITTSVVRPFVLFSSLATDTGLKLHTAFRLLSPAVTGSAGALRTMLGTLSLLGDRTGRLLLLSVAFDGIKAAAMGAGRAILFMLNPIKLVTGAVMLLAQGFKLLSLAILRNPLVLGGAVLLAGASLAFVAFQDDIKQLISSFGGLKNTVLDVVNIITSAMGAAFVTVIEGWRRFPSALGDLFFRATNAAIRGIESLVNGAIDRLNSFLDLVKDFSKGKIDLGNIGNIDMSEFQNPFAGAASDIGGLFKENFLSALELESGTAQDLIDRFTKVKEAIFAPPPELPAPLTPDEFDPSLLIDTKAGKGGRERFTFEDAIQNLRDENALLALNTREREINSQILNVQEKLKRPLIEMEKEQLRALIETKVALEEENSLLEEITGAQGEFARKQDTLNRLLDKGKISIDEYNDKLRQMKIAALETARDMESGITRGLLKVQEEFGNVASVAESAMTNSLRSVEDAFVRLAETGKFSIKDLVNTIQSEITRIAVRQSITGPLANALGGASGGLGSIFSGLLSPNGQSGLGSIFGGLGSLFGFANGGEFTVGGASNAPDKQLVMFNATKGENVKVTPRGQSGGNERPINVNFNINTPDAESFARSQGQILSRTQTALSRASRRNN